MNEKSVFHTRHDFAPSLVWPLFQILSGVQGRILDREELLELARELNTPLRARAEIGKVLAGMEDIGLLVRESGGIQLSAPGLALAHGVGRYETGFRAAVHCLYFWGWLWEGVGDIASPSWSYREVCARILAGGAIGVTPDDIVMHVVSKASEVFRVGKVSFSTSSVSGVTNWLQAQVPPLILKSDSRLHPSLCRPGPDQVRLNLAALLRYCRGDVCLDERNLALLSESLMATSREALGSLNDYAQMSDEFMIVQTKPARLLFRGTREPFLSMLTTPD
jgi:hypothetical protein